MSKTNCLELSERYFSRLEAAMRYVDTHGDIGILREDDVVIGILAKQAGYRYLTTGNSESAVVKDTGNISDGYHTFSELYDHRCLLFVWLMNIQPDASFKTRKHKDGTQYNGWFIGIINTPHGEISYHLPDKLWDACKVSEVEKHDSYDDSNHNDILQRLQKTIETTE